MDSEEKKDLIPKSYPKIKGRQLTYDPEDENLKNEIRNMLNLGIKKFIIIEKLKITEYYLNKVIREENIKTIKKKKKLVQIN